MKVLSNILVKAGVIVDNYIAIGTNSPLAGYNIDSRGSHSFGDTSQERYHYFSSSNVSNGSALTVLASNTSANSARSHIMLADTASSVPSRFGLGVYTGASPYAYLDSASRLALNPSSGSNVIVGGEIDNGYKFQVHGSVWARIPNVNGWVDGVFSIAPYDWSRPYALTMTVGNYPIRGIDNQWHFWGPFAGVWFDGPQMYVSGTPTIIFGRTDGPANISRMQIGVNDSNEYTDSGSYPFASDNFYRIRTEIISSLYTRRRFELDAFEVRFKTGSVGVEVGKFDSTGSLIVNNLSGSGSRFVVADATGALSAVSTSATISADLATDYDPSITGSRNSVNKIFTLSQNFVAGSTRVFVNGIRYTRGSSYDYVESASNQITFTNAPDSGDLIVVDYVKA